jgi:DNA-binding response OmpR family regulator
MKPTIAVLGHLALETNSHIKTFRPDVVYVTDTSHLAKFSEITVVVVCAKEPAKAVYAVMQARQSGYVGRVIILAHAEFSLEDEALLYTSGADNYLAKGKHEVLLSPILEMSQRVWRKTDSERVLKAGNLQINTETLSVTIGNKRVPLSKTEFEILSLLVRRIDTTFSRSVLLDIVWKDKIINDRSIDSHIKRLRQKLQAEGVTGFSIVTDHGLGFRGAK